MGSGTGGRRNLSYLVWAQPWPSAIENQSWAGSLAGDTALVTARWISAGLLKNPIQTELKTNKHQQTIKTKQTQPKYHQIRQDLSFLTSAQTFVIRKYQLLHQLFGHPGVFYFSGEKSSRVFSRLPCVSVRSETSCLLCISVSLCLPHVTPISITSRWFAMLTKDHHHRDTERKGTLCSCQQP